MDEIDAELAFILACCTSADDFNRQLAKYATIVQRLVCRMAREGHQTEQDIRTVYASFADMAVEQHKDQREFPVRRKPH